MREKDDPVAWPYPPGTRTVVRLIGDCPRCGKSHELEFRPLTEVERKMPPHPALYHGPHRWWALCPETGEPVLMAPDQANGRCETCRWWKEGEDFNVYEIDRSGERWGACTLVSDMRQATELLDTRDDFGCVAWEPKSEDSTESDICLTCGAVLTEPASFCPECGADIDQQYADKPGAQER